MQITEWQFNTLAALHQRLLAAGPAIIRRHGETFTICAVAPAFPDGRPDIGERVPFRLESGRRLTGEVDTVWGCGTLEIRCGAVFHKVSPGAWRRAAA